MKKFTIATRNSPLALAQVDIFIEHLVKQGVRRDCIEILSMTTQGDKDLTSPLFHKGGKGLFVREVEQALLEEKADFAVHSLKDLPLTSPDKIELVGFLSEDCPYDLLVSSNNNLGIEPCDILGTSSLRRAAQLNILYPHCQIKSIRGSVQTRLNKNDGKNYHKILLAQAGVKRLGLDLTLRSRTFDPHSEVTPAFCQGIIGIQTHVNNKEAQEHLKAMTNFHVFQRQYFERFIAELFGATCQSAFGVLVTPGDQSHQAIVFCYKNAKQWSRQKFTFKDRTDLSQELQERFDYKRVNWAQCEEQLF